MKERCPDAKLLCRAYLEDYKLDFTIFSKTRQCNCADIIPAMGEVVWGILYELSLSDSMRLDEAEGSPTVYKRFSVCVTDDAGTEHEAETYAVVTKQGTNLPTSKEYEAILQRAAERFDFPISYRHMLQTLKTI